MAKKPIRALVISRSHSYCWSCGEGANPNDPSHQDILGWQPVRDGGCKVVYDYVSTDCGLSRETLDKFQPNLLSIPFTDLFEDEAA